MISVRKATHYDALLASGIRQRAILGHCLGNYPSDVIRKWTRMGSRVEYIRETDGDFYIVQEGREPVAVGILHHRFQIIRGVFVEPRYMGAGIGRYLVSELERVAREQGLSYLRVNATLNAIAFYAHLGYQPIVEGVVESTLPALEQFCLMEKTLAQQQKLTKLEPMTKISVA